MRIIDNVRPDRQTVMFSATFPRAMEALARRILNKPIEVQVGGRSVVCSDVEQHVVSIMEMLVIQDNILIRRIYKAMNSARVAIFYLHTCYPNLYLLVLLSSVVNRAVDKQCEG